jgi:hypothetical protein
MQRQRASDSSYRESISGQLSSFGSISAISWRWSETIALMCSVQAQSAQQQPYQRLIMNANCRLKVICLDCRSIPCDYCAFGALHIVPRKFRGFQEQNRSRHRCRLKSLQNVPPISNTISTISYNNQANRITSSVCSSARLSEGRKSDNRVRMVRDWCDKLHPRLLKCDMFALPMILAPASKHRE